MDDTISREAALDAIDNERKLLIEQNRLGAEHIVVHHARRLIEELPSVDSIPVQWLEEFDDAFDNVLPIGTAIKAWRNR